MYKTQKNHIRCDKQTYRLLRVLCHLSKNLYNYALYHIRQHYFNTQQYLRYESVYHIVKENKNYRLLPSQVAQQTVVKNCKGIEPLFNSDMFENILTNSILDKLNNVENYILTTIKLYDKLNL